MDNSKGDGPYTHGNSFANGSGLAAMLRRNWEYAMAREAQSSIWDNMP